jgi:hypothetical protein
MKFSRRALVELTVVLGLTAALLSSCMGSGTTPATPKQQQVAQLQSLDKLANGATLVLTIARQLQDAEIAAYRTHSVAALTDAKHGQIQTAAKVCSCRSRRTPRHPTPHDGRPLRRL